MSSFAADFLNGVIRATEAVPHDKVEAIAAELAAVRERGGRLFFLGAGGSAGNASHAVNDFRKICGFEAYAPTDNVSELTARVNDEGWETVFVQWLRTSRLNEKDPLFIFAVGGGNREKNISANLIHAIDLARQVGASVVGVVGKDGGYTAKSSETVVIIPTVNEAWITPITEAYQAVIWHLLVTHPSLKQNETMWESGAQGGA